MMGVSMVVPFRGGCPHRVAAKEWLVARLEVLHPEFEIIVCDAPGVWSKSRAVNVGVGRASFDRLAILDADCVPDSAALTELLNMSGWGQPFHVVNRLTKTQTELVLMGDIRQNGFPDGRYGRRAAGGGLIVLDRGMLTEIGGWHEGFQGWGGEDTWLAHMLTKRVGPPVNLDGVLTHLWHPRDPVRRTTEGYRANQQILKEAYNAG